MKNKFLIFCLWAIWSTWLFCSIVYAMSDATFAYDYFSTSKDTIIYANKIEQCGVDSIYSVLKYYKIPCTLKKIIEECPDKVFTEDGMTIDELTQILRKYGLHSLVTGDDFRMVNKALAKEHIVICPHIPKRHMYVFFKSKDDKILCYDPPYGVAWLGENYIKSERYSGMAIIVSDRELLRSEYNFPNTNKLYMIIACVGVLVGLVMLLLFIKCKQRTIK